MIQISDMLSQAGAKIAVRHPIELVGRSPGRMKIRLKPISPKRISDQVFDQLRELIFRGDYQPGQKIMTERELAEAAECQPQLGPRGDQQVGHPAFPGAAPGPGDICTV
jgi:hypothetical protein